MQKIAAALIAAKKEFGPVLKSKDNPHFRSKYADLDACLSAVDGACLAHDIALYQATTESDTGVVVETVFLHASGEELRCGKLHVPAAKHDPQGYGSALTYARRYSLLTACGIAAEDDDGNAAVRAAEARVARAAETLLADLQAAAMEGTEALRKAHATHRQNQALAQVWAQHQASLKDAAVKADADNQATTEGA